MSKIAFRKEFKKRLLSIPQEIIEEESKVIAQKVFEHQRYHDARSVSIFLNMPSGEVRTSRIVEHIFSSGKKCYIPCCTTDSMQMVRLKDMADFHSLKRNAWKIPEPSLDEGRENALDSVDGLDLVIMPGMAFDRDGNRIGYGKGYYDKFLQRVYALADGSGKPRPYTMAIRLSAQLVDKVPTEETDFKPNVIIHPGMNDFSES
jgi:5-formyltetrahydrofolate cyclo-ligase